MADKELYKWDSGLPPLGGDINLDAASVITWGGDTTLGRYAANILSTSDTLKIGSGLVVGSESLASLGSGSILTTGDVYPYGDAVGLLKRIHFNVAPDATYMQRFDSNPGWTWAGSPFVAIGSVSFANSIMSATMNSTSSTPGPRSFYYQSHIPTGSAMYASVGLNCGGGTATAGSGIGLRLDDGTDNNFVEIYLLYAAASMSYKIRHRYRAGGGTVNYAESPGFVYPNAIIYYSIGGTKWTSWSTEALLFMPGMFFGTARTGLSTSGLTWTPTRCGIVINKADADAASWYAGYVDWFYYG